MLRIALCPLPFLLFINATLYFVNLLFSIIRGYPPLISGFLPTWCVKDQRVYPPAHLPGVGYTNTTLDIGSPGSALGLWLFVAILNGFWIVWSLTLVFRRDATGKVLYHRPKLLSHTFVITVTLTSDLDLAWRLLWEMGADDVGPLLMFFQAIGCYAAMILAWCAIIKHVPTLYDANRKLDAIFLRYLVTAGLSAWGTFCFLQAVVSVTLIGVCHGGTPQYLASSVSLCCIACLLMTYMLLDVTLIERLTRTTSSMYDVSTFYFFGITQGELTSMNRNYFFALVFLFIIGVFYAFRIILLCLKNKHSPLFDKRCSDKSGNVCEQLKLTYDLY